MSTKTMAASEVSVGTKLPELPVEITTTMIVAGALASRDFTAVHHDRSAAQTQGMQDVFMNILTTNGLVGRYVTDWAGPDAVIRGVAIKLGAPNLPGDTMRLTGVVTAVQKDTGVVEIEISGRNSWGDHVTGSVKVALPKGA